MNLKRGVNAVKTQIGPIQMGIDKCDRMWRKYPEWKVSDGLKKLEETQKEKEMRESFEDFKDNKFRLSKKYKLLAAQRDAYWSRIGEGFVAAEQFEIREETEEKERKERLENSVRELLLKFAKTRNQRLKSIPTYDVIDVVVSGELVNNDVLDVVVVQPRRLGEIFGNKNSRDLVDCIRVGGMPGTRGGRKLVRKFRGGPRRFAQRRGGNLGMNANYRGIPRRRFGLPYKERFDLFWNDPTLTRTGVAAPKTNWYYQNSLAVVDPSFGGSFIAGVTALSLRFLSYCVTKMIMTIDIVSASTTVVDFFYSWPSADLAPLNTLTPSQVAILGGNFGGASGMVQVAGVKATRFVVVATGRRLVGDFVKTDLHYSAAFGASPSTNWGINLGLAAEGAVNPSVNCRVSIQFIGYAFDPIPELS